MKTKFCLFVAAFFALFSTISCEEQGLWEHDVFPFDINMIIEDTEGNNLLNPEYEGNIIDKIKIIYDGEEYQINEIVTRALPSKFYGLRHFCDDSGKHFITFGNFRGETNYKNEKITIDWGNGTSDEVTFTNKVKGGSHTPTLDIERTIKLNGKTINADIEIPISGFPFGNESTLNEPPSGKAFIIVH